MNGAFTKSSRRVSKNAFIAPHPAPFRGVPMTTVNVHATGSRKVPARIAWASLLLAAAALDGAARAADTTPARQLERFAALAGAPAQPERGRAFFTSRHGAEWSCASCHGNPPTASGKHAGTGKPIEPLAPALNPKTFTDTARIDKWFRRNCNDVLKRECSAAEKADVLAWLSSLKP
jgi:hypothetical protein